MLPYRSDAPARRSRPALGGRWLGITTSAERSWPRSGFCLLPELQVAYDFNSENDWSAILMPEVGKSFMAGSMGITVYIKPGWAVVSPDPAERRSSVKWASG